MTLLIANPGSTSFKCKLYDLATMQVLFQANVERIGEEEGIYSFNLTGGEKIVLKQPVHDYPSAVNLTLTSMKEAHLIDDLAAVGFERIVNAACDAERFVRAAVGVETKEAELPDVLS